MKIISAIKSTIFIDILIPMICVIALFVKIYHEGNLHFFSTNNILAIFLILLSYVIPAQLLVGSRAYAKTNAMRGFYTYYWPMMFVALRNTIVFGVSFNFLTESGVGIFSTLFLLQSLFSNVSLYLIFIEISNGGPKE